MPSFVPRNDVVSPMPKSVTSLVKNSAARQHRNDIKMMPVSIISFFHHRWIVKIHEINVKMLEIFLSSNH